MLRLFGDKTTSKIVELNVWHRVGAHKNFGVVFIKKKNLGVASKNIIAGACYLGPILFLALHRSIFGAFITYELHWPR
jgi:hypothetical protein